MFERLLFNIMGLPMCPIAKDKMSQTALINRNLLDYFFLGHFMKKRCWMFKD